MMDQAPKASVDEGQVIHPVTRMTMIRMQVKAVTPKGRQGPSRQESRQEAKQAM